MGQLPAADAGDWALGSIIIWRLRRFHITGDLVVCSSCWHCSEAP
jgi:hypothetical protein